MEELARVGAATINEGSPEVATILWRDVVSEADLERLSERDCSVTIVVGETPVVVDLTVGSSPHAVIDGDEPMIDGLSLEALVVGVQAYTSREFQSTLDSDGLFALVQNSDTTASRDRIRLLLTDVLVSPAKRDMAIQRLSEYVNRVQSRQRDVEGLFDR